MSKIRLGIISILSFGYFSAVGQTGFNKIFLPPDAISSNVSSVCIDNDTIIVFGNVLDTLHSFWGVYLAKYDTVGNMLLYNTSFDSLDHIIPDLQNRIIKTTDGGYVTVAANYMEAKSLTLKFSKDGNLEWKHAFSQISNMTSIIPRDICEIEDGFLITGVFNVPNTQDNIDPFVYKLNFSGQFQWFKSPGKTFWYDDSGRVVKINNNRFIVGSGRTDNSNSGPLFWSTARFVEIDSTGTQFSVWESAPEDYEKFPQGVLFTNNEELIYSTTKYNNDANYGDTLQFRIRKVNWTTGVTIWNKAVSPLNLTGFSSWTDLQLSTNGNGIDALGNYHPYKLPDRHKLKGWIVHLSLEGEIVWERKLEGYYNPETEFNQNHLYAMAHLSSGSIVAVGEVRKQFPYWHNESWMVKLSAGGCLAPGDCPVSGSSEPEIHSADLWSVQPNPAHGVVNIIPNKGGVIAGQHIEFRMYDASGRTVPDVGAAISADNTVQVDLQMLPAGVYFYTITIDSLPAQRGRLAVL